MPFLGRDTPSDTFLTLLEAKLQHDARVIIYSCLTGRTPSAITKTLAGFIADRLPGHRVYASYTPQFKDMVDMSGFDDGIHVRMLWPKQGLITMVEQNPDETDHLLKWGSDKNLTEISHYIQATANFSGDSALQNVVQVYNCRDSTDAVGSAWKDSSGLSCPEYATHGLCYSDQANVTGANELTAKQACCVCGGGDAGKFVPPPDGPYRWSCSLCAVSADLLHCGCCRDIFSDYWKKGNETSVETGARFGETLKTKKCFAKTLDKFTSCGSFPISYQLNTTSNTTSRLTCNESYDSAWGRIKGYTKLYGSKFAQKALDWTGAWDWESQALSTITPTR